MSVAEPETESQKKSPKVGQRHVQVLLMFFGLASSYFLRVNISVAIVPLTRNSTHTLEESQVEHPEQPTYNWDSSTKSLILSSFLWGYGLAQFPSGLLAKRFGGKIIFGLGMIMGSVVTVLHPVAIAVGGWKLLCALRVLMGFTQGVVFPCMHTLLAKWVPRTERGFLSTTVYSGAQLGATIVLGTSSKIFEWMGWPGIFYISGGVALVWALVFLIFGVNEPAKSKRITNQEREYIESLTDSSNKESKNLPVPWRAILTSMPFLGLIAAQCGVAWGSYFLLTEIPTYMSKVLQLNIKANALLSALPYFTMWILSFMISPISDLLINRRIITMTVSRKLFNSIGQWIPMACLIALGYMTKEEKVLGIALLTVAVGLNAATSCGFLVNHIDLSPNFAGVMMGIANCLANFCSIFAPLIVGVTVKNEEDPAEWRIVFFITAGIFLFCNGFFVIFGKGTIQPWNEPSNLLGTISLKGQSRKKLTNMG